MYIYVEKHTFSTYELSFRTIARAEILILNIVAISTYYSEGINS